MPNNPFNPKDTAAPSINRSSYDLSCNELFTTEFGRLTPVSVTEVVPGTTIRIRACSVGVRGMPTAFPIQTPIKGRLSWFYVRNRNLWKNWEDFIYQTKDVAHPVLQILDNEQGAKRVATGSLADCLGTVTTKGFVGTTLLPIQPNPNILSTFSTSVFRTYGSGGVWSGESLTDRIKALFDLPWQNNQRGAALAARYSNGTSTANSYNSFVSALLYQLPPTISFDIPLNETHRKLVVSLISLDPEYPQFPWLGRDAACEILTGTIRTTETTASISFDMPISLLDFAANHSVGGFYLFLSSVTGGVFGNLNGTNTVFNGPFNVSNIGEIPPSENPYLAHLEGGRLVTPEPLNALPFRAYEFICNYYFRNDLNNPFRINGEVQYNKFIPTDEDGEDTSNYDFHYHNLELDPYTSAVQSPQFGLAPLVGLEYQVGYPVDTARFKFTDTEGHDHYADLGVNPETEQLISIVNTSPDIPAANLRQLTNLVETGFSINSLRTVNAFQRFKENQIRRGLRYRNQLKSHTGVDVDYPDIDIPQYIGGVSAYLNVGQVTNQSQTGSVGLGDYIGTLSGLIKMERDIQVYCPENGFIIGIFSISPTPVYPQSTAKYLLKRHPFDYYQTEFGKIGYVPVTYSEVSPAEVSFSDLNTIFGYQRAWYDYMCKLDRVHGDFKTTLFDFTLARQFAGRPLLGSQFTKVNPDDYNHVFLNRNIATDYQSNAKFLLSVSTEMDSLNQIPRHGTPSLE